MEDLSTKSKALKQLLYKKTVFYLQQIPSQ